ncbi:MAG: hypothetical protein OXB84_06045 [Halobacteriovoraceae bacterium]|nr:hypothetical protein [Halobacteriovoraceae bacterium]
MRFWTFLLLSFCTLPQSFSQEVTDESSAENACLEKYLEAHDEIMAKARSTRNCELLSLDEETEHDERKFYNCVHSDQEKNNPLELVVGMIFPAEGSMMHGCNLYVSWSPVSDFDWTPANQKEDWVGFISEAIFGGITGKTTNWLHANSFIMESFSNMGESIPYEKIQATQANSCDQDFQVINEEVLEKARQQANACKLLSFTEEQKKVIISNSTEHFNKLYAEITKTDDSVKLHGISSYRCISTDMEQFTIHLTSMEMTEESMEKMKMDKENGCTTQVIWSPKTDSFQWTPSSPNYGWIDILDDSSSDEKIGGYYLLSSNKTFMEKFPTATEDSQE